MALVEGILYFGGGILTWNNNVNINNYGGSTPILGSSFAILNLN